MRHYRHLFFDLDHTLWDFEGNSRAVLRELHVDLGLGELGMPADELIAVYEEVNARLWARLEAGTIDKGVLRVLRFRETLLRFGVKDDRLARTLGEEYLARCPLRGGLNPGASALLDSLAGRCTMHIITNGFHEVQLTKLRSSGIQHHFAAVMSSEVAGSAKPGAAIFKQALRTAGAMPGESLMIGDNAIADIQGARGVGLDQVHYAPGGDADPDATHTIAHFDELRTWLEQ